MMRIKMKIIKHHKEFLLEGNIMRPQCIVNEVKLVLRVCDELHLCTFVYICVHLCTFVYPNFLNSR